MSWSWSGIFKRVADQPQLREVAAEFDQYVEARYLQRELAANTSEQVKAFAELFAAVEAVPNAVVLVGNLVVAKYTPANGASKLYAQSLSPQQMRVIEQNPGILASPERVLEMLAILSNAPGPGSTGIEAPPPV